jgi:hypothetical protein
MEFKGCDAATVFEEVRKNTGTQEARSLWNRLLQEMERAGVDGALSYLEVEFQRISENLERELVRLEADQ